MIYVLAILAGALAGFINTLAGSGSLITLPMLIFLGLDATVANATNRVGVLLGALIGARQFKRSGHLMTHTLAWLIVPGVIGAIAGGIVASNLDPKDMKIVIAGVMVLMLVIMLTKPKRWLIEHVIEAPSHRRLSSVLVFLALGFYGGFIQAGVGVLMLAALVLHAKLSLVQANAIKLLMVIVFTVAALAVFIPKGQVAWGLGLLLAAGQCIGAMIAAKFATGHPKANIWIHRLLILIVVCSIIKLSYDAYAAA